MPSVYEVITNRIIAQLESGVAPWHKPWKARGKHGLPRNLVTQREYRGINVWILLSSGYSSPYWLTFRQARELDGHVRQGEIGFPVVYWKFGTREVQDGNEVVEKASVLCRYYTVFNVEQCEGLRLQPAGSADQDPEVRPIEQCERIVHHWQQKPKMTHGGDYASYNKTLDLVRMPESSCFKSAEEYYSTLFHELTHSTGHPTRLNRSTLTDFERFGDQNYSWYMNPPEKNAGGSDANRTSQATLDCDQRRAPATRIVSPPGAQPSPGGSSCSGGVGLCRRTG